MVLVFSVISALDDKSWTPFDQRGREYNEERRVLNGAFGNSSMANQTLPLSEMSSLEALYTALGGDQWIWKPVTNKNGKPWNFTKQGPNGTYVHDPCSEPWQGVFCSCNNYTNTMPVFSFYYYYDAVRDVQYKTFCTVMKIALSRYGLEGTLPNAAFEAFKNLSHLNLGGNKIQGDITTSLCTLSANISVLDVYKNSLTGSLKCLERLLNLKDVNLGGNHIKGSIPSTISLLSRLQVLWIGPNSLTGKIPDSLGNLAELKILHLFTNSLSGTLPSSLGDLNKCKQFVLGTNQLTGKKIKSKPTTYCCFHHFVCSSSLTEAQHALLQLLN